MPILLKTRVERTAKTPVTARRARVGGLCGFRSPAERVPTGSSKTGRCAAVRELWRKCKHRANTRGKQPLRPKRPKEQNRTILNVVAERQDKAAGSCASRGGHICPSCGQFWRFARAFQKAQKSAMGCCRMKKARRFKENGGVPTNFTR